MVIETARCRIRPFEESDLDAFMAYRNNEAWMQYQGFKGLSRQAYRHALLVPPSLETGAQLAVTHKTTGLLLGDVYLKQEDAPGQTACAIGYTITPEQAGHGYAFEAATGMLAWLVQQGFRQATAYTLEENAPSIGLLHKLGFTLSGKNDEGELCYRLTLSGAAT